MIRKSSYVLALLVSVASLCTPVCPSMAQEVSHSTSIVLPAGAVLKPVKGIPNAHGAAVAFRVRERYTEASNTYWEKTAVSIVAHRLPAPSAFGDYDTYEGFAQIPGQISWRFGLVSSLYYPPGVNAKEVAPSPKEYTWAGTFVGITATLTTATKFEVRPANFKTNKLGPAVLEGTVHPSK